MRIGDEVEFNCNVQDGATFGSIGRIVAIVSGQVDQAQVEFPDGSRIWATANQFALCGVECNFQDVDHITEYGLTQRLSRSVRVF